MRIRSFLFALLLTVAGTFAAEQPFNFESTPGKLPKTIVPEEYAVRITPDIKKLCGR